MKHAALFFILGMFMAAMPWFYDEKWIWLILWPAANLMVIGAAYARNDASVFGKRADGALSRARILFFLPYLLLTWGVWRLCLWLPEPATHRINDKLTVGRRLLGTERPAGVTTVLDMTSEFPEPEAVRKGIKYIALPTLDARAPDAEALVSTIRALAPEEHVFIHCAQGHARTGLAAIALLLHRGEAGGIEGGLAMLRGIRPGIGLSADQASCLKQCLSRLRS